MNEWKCDDVDDDDDPSRLIIVNACTIWNWNEMSTLMERYKSVGVKLFKFLKY